MYSVIHGQKDMKSLLSCKGLAYFFALGLSFLN